MIVSLINIFDDRDRVVSNTKLNVAIISERPLFPIKETEEV